MARSNLFKDIPQIEREPLSDIWKSAQSSVESTSTEKFRELFHTVTVRIARGKVTFMFTLLSIIVSLMFLGICLTVFSTVQQVFSKQSQSAQLSIYIKDGTSFEVVQQLAAAAKQMQGVSGVRALDKPQALDEFARMVGEDSALLVGLKEQNPLPASIEVTFAQAALEQSTFERVINEFQGNIHVDSVVSHSGSLSEVGKVLKAVRLGSLFAALGVAFIAAFAIFSAVRLSVFAYQDELEIMGLVGASPNYMRAPFVLEGAVAGAFGGLCAGIVCTAIFNGLTSFLATSSLANVMGVTVISFSFSTLFILIIFGAVIGAVSSWIASVQSIRAG